MTMEASVACLPSAVGYISQGVARAHLEYVVLGNHREVNLAPGCEALQASHPLQNPRQQQQEERQHQTYTATGEDQTSITCRYKEHLPRCTHHLC